MVCDRLFGRLAPGVWGVGGWGRGGEEGKGRGMRGGEGGRGRRVWNERRRGEEDYTITIATLLINAFLHDSDEWVEGEVGARPHVHGTARGDEPQRRTKPRQHQETTSLGYACEEQAISCPAHLHNPVSPGK